MKWQEPLCVGLGLAWLGMHIYVQFAFGQYDNSYLIASSVYLAAAFVLQGLRK